MISINIPGSEELNLGQLVLDYNGTLAQDGIPLPGVLELLEQLAEQLEIHVVTADTHGTVRKQLAGYPAKISVIGPERQDLAKKEFILELGPQHCVAIGNGRNDGEMLKTASLGIGIIQKEGAAAEVLTGADIICTSILDALELILFPDRLRASLRR